MLKPKATTAVAKQDLCQWQLSYFSLTLEDRCSETRFVFCVRYLVWCMLFFINPRLHPILYCYILLIYVNFQETKKQTNNIGILLMIYVYKLQVCILAIQQLLQYVQNSSHNGDNNKSFKTIYIDRQRILYSKWAGS